MKMTGNKKEAVKPLKRGDVSAREAKLYPTIRPSRHTNGVAYHEKYDMRV